MPGAGGLRPTRRAEPVYFRRRLLCSSRTTTCITREINYNQLKYLLGAKANM
jgi:hypothetical protein